MTADLCDVCYDACARMAAVSTEQGFRQGVMNALCLILESVNVTQQRLVPSVTHFQGTYNGTNQAVVDQYNGGGCIRVRSLLVTTEDVDADFKFYSKTSGGVYTAITPNFDFKSNTGVLGGFNPDGWFQTIQGQALYITTSAPVDMIGSFIAVSC